MAIEDQHVLLETMGFGNAVNPSHPMAVVSFRGKRPRGAVSYKLENRLKICDTEHHQLCSIRTRLDRRQNAILGTKREGV